MARYASTAGTPPAAAYSSGATWASDVFSATASSAARVRPATSSEAGSRPHSDGSSRRAAATSPRASSSDISEPVRTNDVPPRATQVAAAVVATGQSRPPPGARGGSAPTERRDRMTALRIAQREVSQVAEQHTGEPATPSRGEDPGKHSPQRLIRGLLELMRQRPR